MLRLFWARTVPGAILLHCGDWKSESSILSPLPVHEALCGPNAFPEPSRAWLGGAGNPSCKAPGTYKLLLTNS
jgi:hypothetical protein